MLRSLDSGVSAMQQFQQQLDVIGNNISNVNTTGFKSSSVCFADALSQTLKSGNGSAAMQVGTGVKTQAISTNFGTGSISSTDVKSDMAISGNGFFVVKDPTTGDLYATRAGNFIVDSDGYLTTQDGLHVQGYSDSSLTTIGDVKIDSDGSSASVSSYSFDSTGTLTVTLDDGTSFTRGQVLLQNFTAPQNLVKAGDNLYSGMSEAGPLSQLSEAGTNGIGSIDASSLEASNVDLTTELSSLITTQRAYEASAHVITTSDDILQTLVNLKR